MCSIANSQVFSLRLEEDGYAKTSRLGQPPAVEDILKDDNQDEQENLVRGSATLLLADGPGQQFYPQIEQSFIKIALAVTGEVGESMHMQFSL
jgi:hypothetical protein